MSELIQQSRQKYRGDKHSEGRLKLHTSCTECHRRKQKCDQQQPCRQCARRYPPPECIYRNPKLENSRRELPATTAYPSPFVYQQASEVAQIKAAPSMKTATVSINTLEDFDPVERYQQMLSSMVSQLQYDKSDTGEANQNNNSSSGTTRASLEDGVGDHRRQLQLRKFRQVMGNISPHDLAISSVDPLHFLGVVPTTHNAGLLHAFINILTKYVFSIDGRPRPNHYNDIWIPSAMKTPLMAYLGIFSTSCYQVESVKTSPENAALALAHKTKSLQLLNEALHDPKMATSTEAIAAVLNFLVLEWHWNNVKVVKQHLNGLVRMTELKGGLDKLGPGHCLRNMILITDYCLCATYEWEPWFQHQVQAPSEYPLHVNIPFIVTQSPFVETSRQLKITKETATILDDMRFLFQATVRQLDGDNSDTELAKIKSTSIWIQERVSGLPDGSGDAQFAKDFVYRSCRLAALVYCRAIVSHIPLSQACSLTDINQLWPIMWQVKLSRWKQIPGIFLFIMLAIAPAAQNTPYGRFLKTMLKSAALSMTLDSWEVVDNSLYTYILLQRRLRI